MKSLQVEVKGTLSLKWESCMLKSLLAVFYEEANNACVLLANSRQKGQIHNKKKMLIELIQSLYSVVVKNTDSK